MEKGNYSEFQRNVYTNYCNYLLRLGKQADVENLIELGEHHESSVKLNQVVEVQKKRGKVK